MIIHVKVKLHSKVSFLEKVDGKYIAHLCSLPVEGKANLELIKLVAKKFGVSSRDVRVKTPTAREKIVEID